ncbi:unnamed protein product [Trichogramma brassicae]|uniref:C-type lectin domain-containing protein n=1 Tax=Trichogramma brassicae TaxID=86971 RepID=A0A6H5J336_9HYME|nr:unnamed protein product [Trichogramma brassicae]
MKNIIFIILLALSSQLHWTSGQLIRDTRCFLENGATAAHLFVSEDMKVGEIVGPLAVLGDPGPKGDIELRLKEFDSPVVFSPYSRNLTLARPLDKEGIDGPASVYVNVICERKQTLDPGFIIPVNIRVTDANDNAPQFINAPYVLNISEVTVVGTRVLQGVRAIDADQPGPYSTVQYSILDGPHSDFFIFANALEGTLVLRKPLDYETLSNFSVGIKAQDQGNPPQSSTTVLYVNVIDADDQNPVFLNDQYRISVPLNIKTAQDSTRVRAPSSVGHVQHTERRRSRAEHERSERSQQPEQRRVGLSELVHLLGRSAGLVGAHLARGVRVEASEETLLERRRQGSIEKLVYKMDFLEKRVKRTEELLYYVISGNNKAKQPCAKNFTRVGQFCYHMSNREYDWKSSASLCRAMGGNLVEFESIEENQDVVAMLQSDKKIRKSYWTGGLNPGLLWIWAASARPVHHDTKQNVIGDGRCLKLEYEPSSRTYMYRGEDCSQKHRFICELSNDDESVNKIERIAKDILEILHNEE